MDEKKQREQYVSGYTSNDKLAIIKNPSPKRRILNKDKIRKENSIVTNHWQKGEKKLKYLYWYSIDIIDWL